MMIHDRRNHRPTQGGRSWRNPTVPNVVLPYNVAAVIAVMQMGIIDNAVIAAAVGLDIERVEQIDAAEDSTIRRLAVEGIPSGEYFKLRTHVRCPRCNWLVRTAPCVACTQRCLDTAGQGKLRIDYSSLDSRGLRTIQTLFDRAAGVRTVRPDRTRN